MKKAIKQSQLQELDKRIDKILKAPLGFPKPQRRKKSERQCLKAELDKLWSELGRLKCKNKCEYCGKEGVNGHHVFSRSRQNTRWDIENYCGLCPNHHSLSSVFSAHKASKPWWPWLEQKRGKKFVDDLEHRSLMDGHGLDLKLVKIYLEQEILKYEKILR